MSKKAFEYLNARTVSHIDMLEPLRRGTAKVIYAGEDGVILLETASQACMIAELTVAKCSSIINFENYSTFAVHNADVAAYIREKYNFAHFFNAHQAAYHKNQPFCDDFSNILLLTSKDAQVIFQNYKSVDNPEYIVNLIDKKQLWGLYENESLAGFMGVHPEGSMGLLEILPKYKRRGYGYKLETFLINYFLEKGQTPFCQVVQGNQPSLKLQQKIGMEISTEITTWLFN